MTREPLSTASLRHDFVTPQLVSGTVLVNVVIAVADESSGILDVFAITILSVLVFWSTDVYVQTVSDQRRHTDEEPVRIGASLRIALHKSRGFLLAGIPPVAFLVVGLFGQNRGAIAYWVALWVGVVILGVVGWIAFGRRGTRWYWRLAGACSTAAFGILAMLLKIVVQ
ncbi:hypothetical protein N1027_09645 [Herbiconiux sp. CPCC 205763]|uniref:VIT family protein n=1 Tax=Herbiconiux aconitum TaxID=2970913 RepID=A0ABT2GQA2_9MICO|nr:hypothetical protein [Herbiconiux aconitum]MCS5718400.1 hypothetical protein [Herbiconiux aconitum]